MSYRYAETPLSHIDLENGNVFARVWLDADLHRADVFRFHHELQRSLSGLARANPRVAGALILDLQDADVASHARLRATFATALQSWELAHRPVGVVQASPSMHLVRIAGTVAPRQCRLVQTEADARAWIDLAGALRALPATLAF